MEITKEQCDFLINIIREAEEIIHCEFCYGGHCSGHCNCIKYDIAIEMLQKIQRTTADMRLANGRPN